MGDMEDQHREILVKHRLYIVQNLHVDGTPILDQLVEDEVLSPEQLDDMMEMFTTNFKLSSALLRHLHKRPCSDFLKFLECLRKHDHKRMALNLQECLEGNSPDQDIGIRDVQAMLAERILNKYEEVKTWIPHDVEAGVSIDELYVDLVLIKTKWGPLDSDEQQLSSYKEIFNQWKGRGVIYLTGQPGAGKSTLSARMSVDWARLYREGSNPSLDEEFNKFKLVLPVSLRTVKPGQVLKDILMETYSLHPEDTETLCDYIEKKSHQEYVLFILDGLDEYKSSTSNDITRILDKTWLPYVNVFVTSRFTSTSYAMFTEGRKPDIQLALRGFTKEGVVTYVHKVYKNSLEIGDKLLNKIRNSTELSHLCTCPALLLMMSTLWHSTDNLGDSITDFYLEYVAYMCRRYEQEKLRSNVRRTRQDILKVYHANLMELGEMASSAMMETQLELSFAYDDIINQVNDVTWNLGILVEEMSFLGGRVVVFPHKTVQEFFVSFYIVHCTETKQKELLARFCSARQAFRESEMIRRFVVGLGGEKLEHQLQTLITGSDTDTEEMHTELQLDYLSENKEANVVLPRVMRLYINDKYPGSHFVRYLQMDASVLEEITLRSRNVRLWCVLQHLHASNLQRLNLYSSKGPSCFFDFEYINEGLDLTLPSFISLRELCIGDLYSENSIRRMINAIIKLKRLQKLSLASVGLLEEHVEVLSKWLLGTTLVSLGLSNCSLTPQDVSKLLKVLPQTVHHLDLSRNELQGLGHIGAGLKHLRFSRLKSLLVQECSLSTQDAVAMIQVIPTTLTELDVSRNCMRDDILRDFTITEHLTNVEKLNLSHNEMADNTVESIRLTVKDIWSKMQLDI